MKKRKSKRTKGKEEARPFEGLSRVNQNAAGVDIGATEIVACVSEGDEIQLVKAFGNYTVDLQAICEWFRKHGIQTVATPAPTAGAVWKVPECIGSRCLPAQCQARIKMFAESRNKKSFFWQWKSPTAGRFGGAADLVASSRTTAGTSRASYPTYAEGTVANEHSVEPGSDGCDGGDGTKDHPCDRGRDAQAGRIGDLPGTRLQAQP